MKKNKNVSNYVPLSEYPNKYSFSGIDLFKFLFVFCICAIHISPFCESCFKYGATINFWFTKYICRLAVPFYFSVSGFFLFRKIDLNNVDKNIIKTYCFKTIRLLGVWTILLIVGGRGHLWYLSSLVVSILILYYLLKKNVSLKKIVVISIVLYLLGLLGNSYAYLLEPLKKYAFLNFFITSYKLFFNTTRNGLFFGLIFLLIGVLFTKKKININLKWSFFGFCISMLLLMGEIYCLKHYLHLDAYDMYLFLVPAVFFLFSFAAQIKFPNKKLCKDLRIVGVLIYFIHLLSYYTFINFLNFTNYHFKNVRFVRPEYLFSVILALLISIIIKKLSDKKKFRWLRYLYS